MLPASARGDAALFSVHLARFPEADSRWANAKLEERWDQLLAVRVAVQGALEAKRREKVIGSSLEATVRIQANPERYELLKQYEPDLPAIFIVSHVEVSQVQNLPSPDFAVDVLKAQGRKCERCWNYRESVGRDAAHPTICDRCIEAIQ